MSTSSIRFRSTTPNLNVLVRGIPKGVAFKDHVFVTTDPAVAAELRQHAACGSEFTEETAAIQTEIAKVVTDNAPPVVPADPVTAPAQPVAVPVADEDAPAKEKKPGKGK